MYFKPLLLPVLAQVLLSFIVMYITGRKRVNEIRARRIDPQKTDTRLHSSQVFVDSAKASDNYANQYETPVLFYTGILLTLMLLIQDTSIVVLAWTYVVFRYIHCFIHLTYNRVVHRFAVFAVGSLVLAGLWVRLGWIIIQS